jgi:tetratricopeptide (TPR) repeat protein
VIHSYAIQNRQSEIQNRVSAIALRHIRLSRAWHHRLPSDSLPRAVNANPQFQRALLLQQQHRYKDAANELRQVLASDPNHAPAHAMLAMCLIELDDLKTATTEAQQAVGEAPDLALTHYALGFVMLRRGWLDEAKLSAEQCIRLDSFDPAHFALLSAIEMERRNWPGALEQAEHGLAIDPDHSWCTNLRAMALVKLGRRDEAQVAMGQALSRNPDSAISHANQGWTLLHQGNHKQAMVHFKEALRLDPNLDWAKAGMVEALKSSFFLYRWLLMFFLWMARLSGRAQWGVIIGAYIAYIILDNIARKNPSVAPFLWPILFAYIGFVAMTWVAVPLFNLMLRLHRYGRYALSPDQVASSNWIGAMLLIALISVIAMLASGLSPLGLLAIIAALLVIPIAGAYGCHPGWPRQVMFGAFALMAIIGIASVCLAFEHHNDDAIQLLNLFALCVLVVSFGTNALRQVRPKT